MGRYLGFGLLSLLSGAAIAGMVSLTAQAENISENASCYPGLPCPGGEPQQGGTIPQNSPNNAPSTDGTSRGNFGENFYYVGQVNPPDPWLALRTEPSSTRGRRIMKMPQGTLLRQIERRGFWWYVELTTGERGWAHSKWIKCCKTLND